MNEFNLDEIYEEIIDNIKKQMDEQLIEIENKVKENKLTIDRSFYEFLGINLKLTMLGIKELIKQHHEWVLKTIEH